MLPRLCYREANLVEKKGCLFVVEKFGEEERLFVRGQGMDDAQTDLLKRWKQAHVYTG